VIDVVIVGGGHNALAAAYYLAKAGRRPLVLERRAIVGGGAVTTEIHPGFRCPRLTHEVLLDAEVARDIRLSERGIDSLSVAPLVCAPSLDGHAVTLYEDVGRTIESLREAGPKDADAYARFRRAIDGAASVVGATFEAPPPDIDRPTAGDIWHLLKTGRRFRSLGSRDGLQLLRWLPMPLADLLGEWFEGDLLRAALAGPGVSGTMLGPRSAGSTLVLLLREASRLRAGGRSLRVRGGPGALTMAMAEAAREAGAEIRTGAGVSRILVRDERVVGVVADGREIACRAVVSSVDPRTTFLSLIDPSELSPDFASRMRNFRARGTVAKVNLALGTLPAFRGVDNAGKLAGRIHIGPTLDYLEQAFDQVKYGEASRAPWLDITIPSIADTELAPAGAHVASIYVHYAPFALRGTTWAVAKDVLFDRTLAAIEPYAPLIRSHVVAAEVITPEDLHTELGSSGGHIFHGELAPDQLFAMRPLVGHGGYTSPIRGLYLCGAGTHPGGLMTGVSGRLAARVLLSRT
jgi:phytoene dehydrogenase-like protein